MVFYIMTLSKAQLSRLRNGHAIQLKHGDIVGSGIDFSKVKPALQKKISSAYHSGKGVRISLDDEELEGTGLGKKFKKAFKKVSKDVVTVANKINEVPKALGSDLTVAQMAKKYDQKHGLTKSVKNFAEKEIDKSRKVIKNRLKNPEKLLQDGVRIASKYAEKAGLDTDLMDNVTGTLIQQTVGRVDPTLGNIVQNKVQNSKQYKRIQDKVNKTLMGEEGKGFAAKGFARQGGAGFLKTVNNLQNARERYSTLTGNGFAVRGAGANTVFASGDMTMLPLGHPAVYAPLPPPRPVGFTPA